MDDRYGKFDDARPGRSWRQARLGRMGEPARGSDAAATSLEIRCTVVPVMNIPMTSNRFTNRFSQIVSRRDVGYEMRRAG